MDNEFDALTRTPWWRDPEVQKLYAIGVTAPDGTIFMDGQKDGWMLEGLFLTEAEAIANITHDAQFVTPVPIGIRTGTAIPDGFWWPLRQTKEQAQDMIDQHRKECSHGSKE